MESRKPKPETAAKIPLYGYQSEWIADESRFKLWIAARQIGKDFAVTLQHVRKRVRAGGLTVWIAAGERQSIEAIEKVKTHNQALRAKFEYEEIDFPGADEKARMVTYKHNGARILALPANPDTVRGYSGDVVLNEFGFHRDALEIWRAAIGIVSRRFHLDVISTPNGQQGKFWELAKKAGVSMTGGMDKGRWNSDIWSVHWTDIYSAVRQGCPVDVKALRAAADDEDTWLQEYECVFLADAENYIPLDLVIACESEQATLELPANFQAQGPLYLGVDIGRKKDRTVVWLKEKLGDVLVTRAVTVLQRTPFQAQRSLISLFMPGVARACIDATGIGAQLAEDLAREWGAKVEQVVFNLENKEKMATAQKTAFENRLERIPAAAFLRRSINAVKRFTSPTGHFRFDAERTDQGHADEFWASALATAAAAGAPAAVFASIEPREEWKRRENRGVLSQLVAQRAERERAGEEPGTSFARGRKRTWS